MNEIAGPRTRPMFSLRAPAYFADAGENVGNRLLLSVMVNSCPRSGFHLEQAAPDRRSDTERRRDCRASFGARRLRGRAIEFIRADDMDCSSKIHGVPDRFASGQREAKRRPSRERLNWVLTNSRRIEAECGFHRLERQLPKIQFSGSADAASHLHRRRLLSRPELAERECHDATSCKASHVDITPLGGFEKRRPDGHLFQAHDPKAIGLRIAVQENGVSACRLSRNGRLMRLR
jgi:hypothetical protein